LGWSEMEAGATQRILPAPTVVRADREIIRWSEVEARMAEQS